MGVYICLLIFVYLTYYITHNNYNSVEKANTIFLIFSFAAIFLLCALRDYTVGRDIPGYIDVYELSSEYKLWDASWVYMEAGYVAYMKLLSMAGLSSRLFLAVTYMLMLVPIFYTIKKYSQDPLLSVIIFICFQFLAFDLSGIRQGMATSICLCGMPWVLSKKKKDIIKFTLLVVLAFLFHKSSLIFLFVPILVRMKFNTRTVLLMLIGVAVSPFLTEYVMSINIDHHLSKYEMDNNLKMFGMIVFLVMVVLFMLLSCVQYKSRKSETVYATTITVEQYTMLLIMSLIVSLAFNGTMLSRSSMFYTIFMMLGIPNAISRYIGSQKTFFRVGFHLFMLVFFYIFCLEPKVLDIVPYIFGHDF